MFFGVNFSIPRSLAVCMETLDFAIRFRWAIAAGVVALALVLARGSFGMCDTIPERRANLCDRLGYEAIDCEFRFDASAQTQATLEITVDEFVSEPGVWPLVPNVRATAVSIRSDRAEAAQIYQILDGLGYEEAGISFAAGLLEPPCAFASCIRKRSADPEHRGLTEAQLVDVQAVVNHILFQVGDAAQIEAFRAAHGSDGIPTITKIFPDRATVADHTATSLASVLRIPVTVQFALPSE